MGVELKTPLKAVSVFLDTVLDILGDEIIKALSSLGDKCVRIARDRTEDESWYNRSGNLRSSIGDAVYADGRKVISSAFAQVLGGIEGSERGRRMIDELATVYSGIYALAVVAAMPYADYIEALDNKIVLASAELWARNEVTAILEQALNRASMRINTVEI